MRTSLLPHDLTAEFRAYHARHRRVRQLAWIGAIVFCAMAGLGLGSLAALHQSLWAAAIVFLLTPSTLGEVAALVLAIGD
jgi:hypothetical protein